jgi:DivIVA domain-containing protein
VPEHATIGRVTLLFTLLTLAVLGVVAAVATGKIAGGLEEPSTSLAAQGLPEGRVTPESVEAVRFSPAVRGYRMEEVDAVLDRLGVELARRDRQILQLSHELRVAEGAYRAQAERGAAGPERAVPGTGPLPDAGSLPVNGVPGAEPLPDAGSLPVNGVPDAEPLPDAGSPPVNGVPDAEFLESSQGPGDQDRGAGSGDGVAVGRTEHGDGGQEHPDQVRHLQPDEPGSREG